MSLNRRDKVYVAGHRGLAGSAIVRALAAAGFTDVIGRSRAELDLRDREAARAFFAAERPVVVVLAAARVGGILANATEPVEFLSDNLRIGVNVLDAAREFGVHRLLFLGSSCVYPREAAQPIREDALLTGPLEPTNQAYAVAKIAGMAHVGALRAQYGLPYVSVMPSNLYGPGDTFDAHRAHVLPAIIARFHRAREAGDAEVRLWGTGSALREFLHVDDFARACLTVLDEYDEPEPINIGTGVDLTIGELAELVAEVVGYRGAIAWDAERPDGTPRKLLDISRITGLGWAPRVELREGVARTYTWYRGHVACTGES